MTHRYRPNVTVACVIEAENRFLLVEEWIDGKQCFNQPAGHLEAGESLIDACQREVWEETGLRLAPQSLLRIDQYSANAELAFLRFSFCCQLDSITMPSPQDKAIFAAHWFSYEDILKRQSQLRSPLVLRVIDSYRNGSRYPLQLLHSELLALAATAKP